MLIIVQLNKGGKIYFKDIIALLRKYDPVQYKDLELAVTDNIEEVTLAKKQTGMEADANITIYRVQKNLKAQVIS
ncbi:hypothetical protein FLA4_10620 [Candidatus Rickettsia kotlanii]|nr:hypothetical protein FLA4_10620 [Candidatus Rickettsia kotlanii]BDU61895.1 hypothetical protein HM2_10630 [Candidatus Rickettsia kotlanii]